MKNCISTCVPAHSLGHYWRKKPFRVVGTGIDRSSAWLESAKNFLLYPSRHILSQHPTHTPQTGYHGVTEVAKTAQMAKMAEKCINYIRSCHSAPYKPYGVGTRKHFFGSKSKKTKRFMIFDPPKKGGAFFTPPPPNSLQTSKKLVSSGGDLGGPDQKLIGGCVYWTN